MTNAELQRVCYWLADNYALWQPFGLLLAVGVLIASLTLLVEMAS